MFTNLFRGCVVAVTLALSAQQGFAQVNYPNRPIKVVIPQAPGSGADVLARLMSDWAASRLSQPLVVENRPGANGVIAAAIVKDDKSGGHALLLSGQSVFSFNPFLYKNLSYDPFNDFTYIAPIAETAFVLVASTASKIESFNDLVQKAKAKDGSVTYGSAGVGNSSHLTMEMIADRAGMKLVHVPYKGSTPVLNAMLGGEVDITVGIPSSAGPLIKEGKLTGLATLSEQRLPAFPDLPTLKELGVELPPMESWYALVGPAGMTPEQVSKLNELTQAFLNDPDVRARLATIGLTPFPGSAEQVKARAQDDAKVWGDLIAKNNIILE